MLEQFSRTQLLLGSDAVEALGRARVAVFGIGGVGGYAVEALARAGVGSLDLVDNDDVSVSNINRQIIATLDTVGKMKARVAADRVASINPQCTVRTYECFFLPATCGRFDFSAYDYVIDAVDTVTAKLSIIKAAKDAGTPVISVMGAANKLDPARFQVADIQNTRVCPLAKIIRKESRKRGLGHFKVVYSDEPAMELKGETDENPPEGRRALPGSVSFVPPVAGLIAAGEVVRDLLGFERE